MVLTGKPHSYWDQAGAIGLWVPDLVLGLFFLPEILCLGLTGPKIARKKLPVPMSP